MRDLNGLMLRVLGRIDADDRLFRIRPSGSCGADRPWCDHVGQP
jgi:hypothetical protein